MLENQPVAGEGAELRIDRDQGVEAGLDFQLQFLIRDLADDPVAGLVETFELLSLFPGIALRVDHLRSGYRRYRFESHIIFFTVEKDHIVIRHLFHAAQNITKAYHDVSKRFWKNTVVVHSREPHIDS